MKRIITMIALFGLSIAAKAQNDPLSISSQTKGGLARFNTYTTGGFKVLVKNNTTGKLEVTNYVVAGDTVHAPFQVLSSGGNDFMVTTPIGQNPYFGTFLETATGAFFVVDTTGTYGTFFIGPNLNENSNLNNANYGSYNPTGSDCWDFGIGDAGEGYFYMNDSENGTSKFLNLDAYDGITAKDTLFMNGKFMSMEGVSGAKILTGDSTGVNITNLNVKTVNTYSTDTLTGTANFTSRHAVTWIKAQSSAAITLVNGSLKAGDRFTFKTVVGSAAVTFSASSGRIDAAATYVMIGANKYVTITYDGTNYWVLGNN